MTNTHKVMVCLNLRSLRFWRETCGCDTTEACARGHSCPLGAPRISKFSFHTDPSWDSSYSFTSLLQHMSAHKERVQVYVWNTDPKHNLDVDAAGRTRILQLEPLVHGEVRRGQNTDQRDGQAAQRQSTVIIFNLVGQHSSRRCKVKINTAGKANIVRG